MITSTVKTIEKEMIDGAVFLDMTEKEMKEIFTELRFGPMKKLLKARDQFVKDEDADRLQEICKNKSSLQRTEYIREFGHEPSVFESYQKGKILNKHEERTGNLISPVRQFFPCLSESPMNISEYIADKVTEFSAACLNDRTNGTIYFGIGDVDCEQFVYGEVVGIVLDKKECEDAVRLSIKRRFSEETSETALRCIKPPFFMHVRDTDFVCDDHLFVCEVDIEPRSDWVKDQAFFISFPLSPVMAKSENANEKGPLLYRFTAGIPTKQDAKQVEKFSAEKLQLTKDRRQQEKSLSSISRKNLVETLKDCMCGGGDKLEGTFYRILATPSINVSHPDFSLNFQFIFNVDWRCILDFDPKSDESGLYGYADNDKKQVYILKTPDSFLSSPTADSNQTRTWYENQLQDLMESPYRQWIFCNGYATAKDEGLQVLQWKQKRSEGYRETVRLLKQSIPKKRAVILILVTSHDDVFIEASEDLILKFENQWLMIAECRRLADAWIDGLKKRNVIIDKDRCICEFSFSEVNKAIAQLLGAGVTAEGVCVVATTSGTQETLTKQMQQELCDLDIVSVNQCCNATSLSKEEVNKLSMESEDNFYKGNTATWWNFHFQGHVCQRDRYEHLLTYTTETLNGEYVPENENIGRVAIYHQPGAGGTTVALNVLWDLKSKYKCCRIQRITKDTARQIFTLYELGEHHQNGKNPVLVMVDNEDDDKVIDLRKNIEEECDARGISEIICVFLLCIRRISVPQEHEKKKIILLHKLSQRECHFFLDKYKILMERYSHSKDRVNPDSLLGLNIMKANFSEDYIKRTVKLLLEVFQDGKEKTVLKYIALLNHYDLSFRGIPVTCFDPLMGHRSQKTWEVCMPDQPLLTYTYNMHLSGRTKCLRISCQLLCKYILDISLDEDKSHGDLMEELLCGPVIRRLQTDVAYQELLIIIKEIMKKRFWTDEQTRSTFSPFIQNLFEEKEYDLATICMKLSFERTFDPMLAQHLARFYICCKNWKEAETWADKAIEICPKNSFLWDTKGQVSKFRLIEILNECEASQSSVTPDKVEEAIQYAQQALAHFKQEQNLCTKEAPNMAGYFGQMDIIVYLIKILKCCSIFHSSSELQSFFSNRTFVPAGMKKLGKEVEWLKSLQDLAFQSLRCVEDCVELYSACADEHRDSAQSRFLNESNLDRYRTLFNGLFGEDDLLTIDPQKMDPEKRRRAVRKLGGCSLFSIMKMYREQDGRNNVFRINMLMSLNLKLPKKTRFDLSMALASATCLCSDLDQPDQQKSYLTHVLEWSAELCKMKEKQEYIDLDPFVYFLVFHWPTPNRKYLDCQPSELYNTMNKAVDAFKKKVQQNPAYRKKNIPLFFLTNLRENDSIVSYDTLAAWAGTSFRGIRTVKKLLKSPQAINLLERFSGVLDKTGWKVRVTLESQQGNKMDLDIPLFTRENRQTLKMKRVFFVLGFGHGGPVACDVDSDHPQLNLLHGTTHLPLPRHFQNRSSVVVYDQRIDEIMNEILSLQACGLQRQAVSLVFVIFSCQVFFLFLYPFLCIMLCWFNMNCSCFQKYKSSSIIFSDLGSNDDGESFNIFWH